jgi:hypothetical protein
MILSLSYSLLCTNRAALAKYAALKLDSSYTEQGVQWYNDAVATAVCQRLFTWANALIEVCVCITDLPYYI